jgi:hypothetical protein
MNKIKPILIGIGTFMIMSSVALYIMGASARKPNAGISINSVPASTVFIDGQEMGQTPFKQQRKSGEVVIKLVPQTSSQLLAPYETKVRLNSKIETVVDYSFGETDEAAQGQIISFEKVSAKEISLAVVTRPDSASIFVDGRSIGFSPQKSTIITPGKHELKIVSPGYLEKTMDINMVQGYKLTAVIKLALSGEVIASPTPTPIENVKVTLVEIGETPTGFLRIRGTPSASGELLAEAKPGEKFRYLETDAGTGWYKVEYLEGKEGWVSNTYSKLVDEVMTPTPTPTSVIN